MAMASAPPGTSSSSSEVKHLAERLNAAQIKIKRLNRLEAAFVDFFMEVMDRSVDTGGGCDISEPLDSAFARQKRKEQFLRKADGDSISLLNALRTHLRLQFTAQSEQQSSLSSTLSAVASRKDIQEKDAKDEIYRLEASCEAYRQRIDVLVAQISESERACTRLERQYKCCVDQMSGELHLLRAQGQSHQQHVQQQQLEVETLKQICEVLIKEKKTLLDDVHNAAASIASPSPSAAVQSTGSSQDLPGSTPTETQNLRRTLRDYELQFSKLEAVNSDCKLESQRLQQQLNGYKHNAQAQAFEKLDKDFRRTRAQADEAKKKLNESDADLLRTKSALKERDAKLQLMKGEYNKLFHALQKVKAPVAGLSTLSSSPGKLARLASTSSLGSNGNTSRLKPVASTPSLSASSLETSIGAINVATTSFGEAMTRQQANDNPYLIEHYKTRLEGLEKDIEGFKVQIRKMIASEYRYKQKNRLFRLEKSQLVNTCDRLRLELDKVMLSSAKAITNTQKRQLTSSYSCSRSDGSLLSTAQQLTATRSSLRQTDQAATGSGGSTVSEIKKLRQRNLFLEERFRAIVASAGTAKGHSNAGGDVLKSKEQSVLLRPQSAAAAISHTIKNLTSEALIGIEDDEQNSEGELDGSNDGEQEETGAAGDNQLSVISHNHMQIRRQSSIMAISKTPESQVPTSQPTPTDPRALGGADSFGLLDEDTLQALQQVKTKTRVRPQSAQPQPSFGDGTMVDDGDVDPEQHERVAKALEQVNGLKYRYYASPKEAKKVLDFHSDDSDDDRKSHGHVRSRHASKTRGQLDDVGQDEDGDAGLSFDDHIDRILRKTRTIALLKIANNTAEILPEDGDDYDDDDEDAFDFDDGDEFNDEDDVDSTETEDRFNNDDDDRVRTASSPSLHGQKSFRRGNSMRSTANSVHSSKSSGTGTGGSGGGSRRDHDESVAAMRLVRTLSSFLSLPRVISYKDLEMITETLLNEQAGSHDDYGDLIDVHVDSARESSSGGGDCVNGADDPPIWKRRNTNTIQPLTLPDDPGDLELHQRRMFMEANRFSRFSSKNFFSASSKNLMSAMSSKASMRQLGSPSSLSGSFRNGNPSDTMLSKKESKHSGSFRSAAGSIVEDVDDEKRGEDTVLNGDGAGECDPRAEPFDEEEYLKWRTEVKAEYLAWLNAKLEAKRKRRETIKMDAGKKPRWLLLYEASKRPEPKEAKK